ncbi:hypothetical protein Acr_00g0046240 [Actinidia rufa]|uniref:Uncharacterized protein n=1 Tax=Actinidia rufa TaxID=165716 RepID=A0A7J0DJD8_9ERIC|nr:hypothetical protein Acr_00g0046240 [Actinidia rufa]
MTLTSTSKITMSRSATTVNQTANCISSPAKKICVGGLTEDISEQSLNEKACVEISDRDYSGGTNERVLEATGRGQKKRPEKRSQEGGHRGQEKRRDKKNCPRNKAQDQSSEAVTTAMMAVDESDVLLAVSADEESEWIFDSGIDYHLCRDKEVFSTHVACEGLVRMANNTTKSCWQRNSPVLHGRREIHEASGGTLRVSMENRKCCKVRKTEGLYRLEGSVQTRGAVVRHKPSGTSKKNGQGKQLLHRGAQSKRRDIRRIYLKDPEWYRSARRCFEKRAEVCPDMRRCNQYKMSMKKLRGERQSRCTTTGVTSPKRVFFALDK